MELDIAMDDVPDLFNFSGYTTATPTCDLNQWSPLIDWESFTNSHDDFHSLIDSITDDNAAAGDLSPDAGGVEDRSSSVSTAEEDDQKGLRLVHLLIAAAEALTGGNMSHDLARAILVRLKELVSPSDGSNMERLAAYFTDALQCLLDGTGGAHSTSMLKFQDPVELTDMLVAFQLLQDMSPYVKFGHFTANQAILEAVAHERRVHIVDYDIMEGAQWASLIQSLSSSTSSKKDSPHLRITALSRGGGRKSIATVQETGRRLTSFAASVGQPFSFHQCRLGPDETFRVSSLKLVRGEALVFNCMLHLPHLNYRASDSVASFFNGARDLSPRLVALVEEEVGPVKDAGFMGLFMDSLHRYSALYDSLEAGFPMLKWAQSLVERVFLGPRIMDLMGRMFRIGEGEERGSWGEWLGAAGFSGVPISFANHCQAKLLLGLFNDGYQVQQLGSNKLVLGWKSKRLLSASIWTSNLDYDE